MFESAALDSRQFQTAPVKTREINDMRNCFVIDGLPRVVAGKIASLLQAACNFIKKHNVTVKSFEMPTDPETGGSCGYMFIECASKADSDKVFALQDIRFDSLHRLKINPWTDFDDRPRNQETVGTDHYLADNSKITNPYAFLHDKTGREQFLVKFGTSYDVQISWHDPHMNVKQVPLTVPADCSDEYESPVVHAPFEWTTIDKSRKRVQKDFPKWSPLGTYVAAIEENRASLWFLEERMWVGRAAFEHPKIQDFQIGPTEKYALTWCTVKCIIWDIEKCKMLKVIPLRGEDKDGPIFRWNFDETFALYQRHDKLVLYEMATMEKTALPNAEKDAKIVFSWAPDSSVLFYSVEPAHVEKPVRVYAQHVASGGILTEISTRSLYSVTNIEMFWQCRTKSDRIYCAIIMRSTNSNRKDKIDLYRCGAKEIGIEQIEVSGNIVSLEWDPSGLFGSRFCVCSTMRKNAKRSSMRFDFYHVQLGNLRLIKSLEDQQSNVIFWSPKGTHAVTKNETGTLEFYRIDNDNVTQLLLQEHYNCTNASWDPSGRYFVTYIPIHETEIDTGYRIYNFLGQLLFHAEVEKFSHIQWRPRPNELLCIKEQQEILKTLGTRIRAYEEEEERRRKLDQENAERIRRNIIENHKRIINDIRQEHSVDTGERNMLREKIPTLHGLAIFDEVPLVKETILDVKESYYHSGAK